MVLKIKKHAYAIYCAFSFTILSAFCLPTYCILSLFQNMHNAYCAKQVTSYEKYVLNLLLWSSQINSDDHFDEIWYHIKTDGRKGNVLAKTWGLNRPRLQISPGGQHQI